MRAEDIAGFCGVNHYPTDAPRLFSGTEPIISKVRCRNVKGAAPIDASRKTRRWISSAIASRMRSTESTNGGRFE